MSRRLGRGGLCRGWMECVRLWGAGPRCLQGVRGVEREAEAVVRTGLGMDGRL